MALSPAAGSIIGAGISTGGSLLGGLMGDDSAKEAADDQVRFAKKAIRWRVRDAKAAGLHPLYALGASTNAFSPSFIGGQSPMGSAVADSAAAIAGGVSDYTRHRSKGKTPVEQAQLRALNSQSNRDEAAANLDNSRAARELQAFNYRQDGPLMSGQPAPGIVKGMPSEVISAQPGNPSVTAGKKPFFAEYKIGKLFGKERTMYAPQSDEPAEALENIGGILASIPKNIPHAGAAILEPYINLLRREYNKLLKKRNRQTNRRGRNR